MELLHNKDVETVFWGMNRMMTYEKGSYETKFMSLKCRLCKVCLPNPEELRIHSMVKHKGHMLLSIKS
jgi:hypothetical protein